MSLLDACSDSVPALREREAIGRQLVRVVDALDDERAVEAHRRSGPYCPAFAR